jgi:hypothetical protein
MEAEDIVVGNTGNLELSFEYDGTYTCSVCKKEFNVPIPMQVTIEEDTKDYYKGSYNLCFNCLIGALGVKPNRRKGWFSWLKV